MCSNNCPCADVPEKDQWLTLDDPAGRDLIENPFDFSGSITSYKECFDLVHIDNNPRADPTFIAFAHDFIM